MWGSRGAVAALAALGLALAGCSGSEDTSSTQVQVNTPLQIAQESADDYNDNVNGLITGKTLSRWLSDWENERPAGVTGRLIILQQGDGSGGIRVRQDGCAQRPHLCDEFQRDQHGPEQRRDRDQNDRCRWPDHGRLFQEVRA
jgi:hypothetical protein